jgi:alpha-L-rhamnosidase
MRQMKKSLAAWLFLAFVSALSASATDGKIRNLRVEYTTTPLGIDAEQPRFSWEMDNTAGTRGEKQTAYQIIVRNEDQEEVWNTGKVESDLSLHIRYCGQPLAPSTRYDWELTVWDEQKEKNKASSWFETGLMSGDSAYRNWNGARWISYDPEEKNLYTPYLPVFRLHFAIQLDESSRSTRASLIYGANDERLMNACKNIYHLASPQDSSYIQIELDIAPLDSGGEALLHIYRAGYHPADRRNVPLKSIAIPSAILNVQNRYAKHVFSLSTELGVTRLYAGKEATEIGRVDLNPLGQGGDFIAFPVVADVGFALRPGQKATFSDCWLANFRSPEGKLRDLVTAPLTLNGGKSGFFRVTRPEGKAAPMLRTVFATQPDKAIARARLYITARGIYDVHLNGQRISTEYFNPGLTQYNKTHHYQTYDVTPYLQAGENAIGVQLGEGWWSGAATFTGDNWNFFGDCQSVLAQLAITYADGSKQYVVTDPTRWQACDQGPLLYGSLFQGEVYDARREIQTDGWDTPQFAPSVAWKQACEIPLEGHISHEGSPNKPKVDDYSQFTLTGQYGPAVQSVQTLTACALTEPRPGVFVYDMGQNIAGVPEINLPPMEAGRRIALRYAEILYPALPEYAQDSGMLMLENIRAAMAQDLYITRGGKAETIAPRFTFHGYRYIEITGLDAPLPLDSVKSNVLSSLQQLTASYTTSDPRVNRLWENITWSARANFLSIPTDCPQRNERMGWAGDISVFAPTATYLADVAQFLPRYLQAMRDVQRPDGRFPDIAPLGGGFGGLLWGSAGITVPWQCFQQYADTLLLQKHFPAMERYIDYILWHDIDPQTHLIVQDRAWGDLCDWLGPEDNKNDKSLVWEAYFIHDLDLMEQMATVLHNDTAAARYRALRDQRKEHFRRTYLSPDTARNTIHSAFQPERKGQLVDTQTSYALPLVFDIAGDARERQQLARNLIRTLRRTNLTDRGQSCPPYSLMTGFIGTAWISEALSANGYTDDAYSLLLQTDYPSWLYPVEQGATTIWERLDSYTHTRGFGGNNRMNSFNHYSFGAVGAWMCSRSLGIQRDTHAPGFKHFILKPEIDPSARITHAEGYYQSPYGRIESRWAIGTNSVSYYFRIPANTTATLYLPANSLEQISESGRPIGESSGIEPAGATPRGLQVLELLSGEYHFEVQTGMP